MNPAPALAPGAYRLRAVSRSKLAAVVYNHLAFQ